MALPLCVQSITIGLALDVRQMQGCFGERADEWQPVCWRAGLHQRVDHCAIELIAATAIWFEAGAGRTADRPRRGADSVLGMRLATAALLFALSTA